MYTPPKFKVEDTDTVHAFIKENSLGLLLSVDGDEINDTHTPFTLSSEGKLLGHMAKANDQWKSWSQTPQVKVIFTGPHSYISPSYYTSEFNVPTWNYSAVSIVGQIKIISDQGAILDFLDALTIQSENSSPQWKLNREDERYLNLLAGIVVFEISINHVEASFKMNQNKSAEDKSSVMQSLQKTGCPFDSKTASFMSEVNGLGNTEQDICSNH